MATQRKSPGLDSSIGMTPFDIEEPIVNFNGYGKKDNDQLPAIDRPRFILLVILYLIQGIPIGLAFGSVPFLLKSNDLSYSQVGLFSLATYPYSLKLFWSPIVDTFYSKAIGKRRSWILPIQLISGVALIVLSSKVDAWMADDFSILKNLTNISCCFFLLILLCATQDIAVDGWALTILSKHALSYASTAQTIGINSGYFLSFTVFLAFNSADFANKYFRYEPLDYGFVSLGQYMSISGILYLVVTIIVWLLIPENPPHLLNEIANDHDEEEEDDSVIAVYKKMVSVMKLPAVRTFIIIHLICKIGFQANEGATNLKLLDKGLKREDLAITVLIDFPFEIIFGYYAARWSNSSQPLKPWLYGYLGRILAAVLGQILVLSFPDGKGEIGGFYFGFVILQHLLTSFMSTVQFVSICAFHTQIADPAIGGTYMTLLNTLSNLGGNWPKIVTFWFIDKFSESICVPNAQITSNGQQQLISMAYDPLNPFKQEPFYHCYSHQMKQACLNYEGTCVTTKDGYFITNALCILIGLALYFIWIKKTAQRIQGLRGSAWRVNRKPKLPI